MLTSLTELAWQTWNGRRPSKVQEHPSLERDSCLLLTDVTESININGHFATASSSILLCKYALAVGGNSECNHCAPK